MKVTVYGDFNCPYSYLASMRADRLIAAGAAEVDWRAVEHDRLLPVTGSRSADRQAEWDAELAEVASLAVPGERVPGAPPALVSNTKAAVAAYAESVADGLQDELRQRLFEEVWVARRHLSSAYEVRRVITSLTWPAGPLTAWLAAPDLPHPLDRDPDLARITRRSGGTIAPDGGPLTTDAYRRIESWRAEWLALPQQIVPTVVDSGGRVLAGADGLGYLARAAAPDGEQGEQGTRQLSSGAAEVRW